METKRKESITCAICGVYSHLKCYGLDKMSKFAFAEYTHTCFNCSNTNTISIPMATGWYQPHYNHNQHKSVDLPTTQPITNEPTTIDYFIMKQILKMI